VFSKIDDFWAVKKGVLFFTAQSVGEKRVKKSSFSILLRHVKISLRVFFTQSAGSRLERVKK
jgi:hypothetical protein